MIRAAFTAIQCRVLHSPTIISQPFAFVKGFFKTFLSFFRLFFKPFSLTPCRADVKHIISHSVHFVKYLFKSFFNFFRDPFSLCLPTVARSLTAQLFDSLHIIALRSPFVNSFLESFFGLELQATMHKERASRLCNLPNKWLILIPNRGVGRILNAHFPRFQILQAAIGVLRDHPHASRGRSVHHEGLDEPIVYI